MAWAAREEQDRGLSPRPELHTPQRPVETQGEKSGPHGEGVGTGRGRLEPRTPTCRGSGAPGPLSGSAGGHSPGGVGGQHGGRGGSPERAPTLPLVCYCSGGVSPNSKTHPRRHAGGQGAVCHYSVPACWGPCTLSGLRPGRTQVASGKTGPRRPWTSGLPRSTLRGHPGPTRSDPEPVGPASPRRRLRFGRGGPCVPAANLPDPAWELRPALHEGLGARGGRGRGVFRTRFVPRTSEFCGCGRACARPGAKSRSARVPEPMLAAPRGGAAAPARPVGEDAALGGSGTRAPPEGPRACVAAAAGNPRLCKPPGARGRNPRAARPSAGLLRLPGRPSGGRLARGEGRGARGLGGEQGSADSSLPARPALPAPRLRAGLPDPPPFRPPQPLSLRLSKARAARVRPGAGREGKGVPSGSDEKAAKLTYGVSDPRVLCRRHGPGTRWPEKRKGSAATASPSGADTSGPGAARRTLLARGRRSRWRRGRPCAPFQAQERVPSASARGDFSVCSM